MLVRTDLRVYERRANEQPPLAEKRFTFSCFIYSSSPLRAYIQELDSMRRTWQIGSRKLGEMAVYFAYAH